MVMYYRTAQQQMNDVLAFGMSVLAVALMFSLAKSLASMTLGLETESFSLLPQTTKVYTHVAVFCGPVRGRSAVAVRLVDNKVTKVAGVWPDEGAWERHTKEMKRFGLRFVGYIPIDQTKSALENYRIAMDKLCPHKESSLQLQTRCTQEDWHINQIRKDYMDRVFNDLLTLEGCTGRAKIALEQRHYGEAYNAVISADTIARGLYEAFPLAHFAGQGGHR